MSAIALQDTQESTAKQVQPLDSMTVHTATFNTATVNTGQIIPITLNPDDV